MADWWCSCNRLNEKLHDARRTLYACYGERRRSNLGINEARSHAWIKRRRRATRPRRLNEDLLRMLLLLADIAEGCVLVVVDVPPPPPVPPLS